MYECTLNAYMKGFMKLLACTIAYIGMCHSQHEKFNIKFSVHNVYYKCGKYLGMFIHT